MNQKQIFTIIAGIAILFIGLQVLLFTNITSSDGFVETSKPSDNQIPASTTKVTGQPTFIIYLEGEKEIFYEIVSVKEKTTVQPGNLNALILQHQNETPNAQFALKASPNVDDAVTRSYVKQLQDLGIDRFNLVEIE